MNYTDIWDLATIPDPPFRAEVQRRRAGRRAIPTGGKRAVIRPCPVCGEMLNARAMIRHYNADSGKHRQPRMPQ